MNDEKKLKALKQEYDNIKIPNELGEYVKNGIEHGKAESKRKKRKKIWGLWAASAAAAFLAFTISINTIPSFADSMSNIPGIGKLVQVLKFEDGRGHGGVVTDGADVSLISLQKDDGFENIIINMSREQEVMDIASYFDVEYSEYPYALTFAISGARKFSAQKYLDALEESDMIREAYKIITLDDSMIRFAIIMNEPFDYEVMEYKEPAQIIVYLSGKEEPEKGKVYSLRSSSYDYGEQLGMIEEQLAYARHGGGAEKDVNEPGNVRILKDQKSKFCVEVGYFHSMEEAEMKRDELKGTYQIIESFHIEERGCMDLPKYIE